MSADEYETLVRGGSREGEKPPETPAVSESPAVPKTQPKTRDSVTRPEQTIISLQDVYKGFGSGDRRVEPMSGITLNVQPGKTLVVIGPSGTGKSVMLRLMLGLLEPDSGEVYVFGKKISAMSNVELGEARRRMSMLFQGGALFDSMTVGENVAFPLRAMGEKDEQKIMAVVSEKLGQVGLPNTEDKMPSELSGGMKKRAALARSIASQPEVILYDEPTTGLDPIMSDAIGDLINETHKSMADTNVTSIVVTHDMHVATKVASRIVMLYGGKIVGDGPPDMYRRLGTEPLPKDATETDRMIRQFVRGEADGPIQTVA